MVKIEDWNIEELCGYVPKTTFYTDFSIAERFGADQIVETYYRVMREWRKDAVYLTELVMVLNWKTWRWCDGEYGELYDKPFWKASGYAESHLKGRDLKYYYKTID